MKTKNRKKKIRLMLTICLLIMALSGVTYAWFEQGNRLKVTNLSLMASGSEILEIADDLGNGPGEYESKLDLNVTEGKLEPVTTKNGTSFYAPVYVGNTVVSVKPITDDKQLDLYIYEKSFYLRVRQNTDSEDGIIVSEGKVYDVFLAGTSTNLENGGTHVYQLPDVNGGTTELDTAVNAIRISFELGDGTVVIYEPNADRTNRDTNRAEDQVKNEYGRYETYKQAMDGRFMDSENSQNSPKLFQMKENEDVKVTMRVWIEGTDLDCTDSIAWDKMMAMFEFFSKEVSDQNEE